MGDYTPLTDPRELMPSLFKDKPMTNEFREKLIETIELIEPLALIKALEAITANMPIGDVDTHRARDKVEKLRKLHEVSKLPVKAGD